MVNMARYEQRPENALKRANEFMEIGKASRALDTLQEVFKNKQYVYKWSESVLEPIMLKYLNLCVELKKSHIAKEGLFQYRNMCQSVNVVSLENVIREYLRLAEEKAENARVQSTQAIIDIDNLVTLESILLSTVSGEDAQDRSHRSILTPWVKFLWESYCQCLDLLRTNALVENLYHDIARKAFQFCHKYNKKTEFRKLCDKLRKHLEDICKLPDRLVNVSMSKSETQQLHIETRLDQLDVAIQMELWQEAYKSIEDIKTLIKISKKIPTSKIMANYYQKLAVLFWKAGNTLFHAATLFKLLQFGMETKKNASPEEVQEMACRSLLATLSIPLPSSHPEFDSLIETDKSHMEKVQKLANLLDLTNPPTRASLLKDLDCANFIKLTTPQLQELYNCLEIDFDPLNLTSRVQTLILYIHDDVALQQYVVALQNATLARLVRQVAQVYQTIEFPRFLELAKFATRLQLERLLVDCVRNNDMQIRIDHVKQCIHFGENLGEEKITLQNEPVRNQLMNMSNVLNKVVHVISTNKKKAERESLRTVTVQNYLKNREKEHQKILQRHKIIEDRKEYTEKLNRVREENAQKRVEEILHQQILAEKKRFEEEMHEREKRRQQKEVEQIKHKNLQEKLQQISQTEHGQKILRKMDEDDIKKLDADQIAVKEAEELQKERRELQAKLKSQQKKLDYFERAKRLEEIPLWLECLKDWQLEDQAFWEGQEKEKIALAIAEHKLAVCNRDRLIGIRADKDQFLIELKKSRHTLYEAKVRRFEKLITEERNIRLAQRKNERKLERRARREKRDRLALEEKKHKEQLHREKIKKEEKEREDRENEELRERAATKQKAREEEIERKLQKEKGNRTENWRTIETYRDNNNKSKKTESRIPKHRADPDSQGNWRRYTKDSDHDREEDRNNEAHGFSRVGHNRGERKDDKERGDFRYFSK